MVTQRISPPYPLAELHAHLSTSINPSVYWQIAKAQGFKLPKRDYKEFIEYITLSTEKRMNLTKYFEDIYHPLLNKLSSGTYAVEKALYEIMSGAYRNNITLIELRTNPMKHNLEGEQDLDHIIMAMLRGMERALLEYEKLSAGIVFCLAREFSFEKNTIIVEKAIKYNRRGIVGIDIAGPATKTFHFKDYQALLQKAKSEGLRITVHSGEEEGANDMWEALEFIQPERIGHGIKAVYDRKLLKKLANEHVVLEVCPLSNLATNSVENVDELRFILQTLIEQNVKFCINTDWPEIIEDAHLWSQFQFLKEHALLTNEQLKQCNETAFKSTFVPPGGLAAYL